MQDVDMSGLARNGERSHFRTSARALNHFRGAVIGHLGHKNSLPGFHL